MGIPEEKMERLKAGDWEDFCSNLAELEKNLSVLVLSLIKRDFSIDVGEIHCRIEGDFASLTYWVTEFGGAHLDYQAMRIKIDVSLAKNRSIKDLIALKEKVHQFFITFLCDCVIKGDWEKDFKSIVKELASEYSKIIKIKLTFN